MVFVLVAAALAALVSAGPLRAQENVFTLESEMPNPFWPRAPAIEGAVPWEVFGSTVETIVEREGERWVAPQFPESVRALEGETIRVNGYIMPLEQSLFQEHFLLLAYPLHCPFCVSAGPTQMVEVKNARIPVEFSYDAVLIEGVLELLEMDDEGMYFRLNDAEAIDLS